MRNEIDQIDRKIYGIDILLNIGAVNIRCRNVAESNTGVRQRSKGDLMRERYGVIVISEGKIHFAAKRDRQRGERKTANHIIKIGDRQQTVFLLIDFTLAENIFRSQGVGCEVRTDRFAVGENFRKDE